MDALTHRVRICVAHWLADRPEHKARLRGRQNRDFHASFDLLLCHVYQRMRTGDWREWLNIRQEVQASVQQCVEALRRGG